MGARTDAALAAVSLAGFLLALVVAEARLSLPFAALGGLGTIGFELLAARDPATVRRYWERRPVQLAALAFALGLAGLGTRVAPSAVLSAGVGALVAYLSFLGFVHVGSFAPVDE